MASRESPYPGTTVERFPVFDKYINWEVRRFYILSRKIPIIYCSKCTRRIDSSNLDVNSLNKKRHRKPAFLVIYKTLLFFFEGGLCFLWPCAVHETNRGIPWRSPAIDRPRLHRVSTFGSRWIFMITSEDYVYSYISLQYKGLASFMIKLHKGY